MTVQVILKAEVETVIDVDYGGEFDDDETLEDALAEAEMNFYRHITQDYHDYSVEGEVQALEYDAYKDKRNKKHAIRHKAYKIIETNDKLTNEEREILLAALTHAR